MENENMKDFIMIGKQKIMVINTELNQADLRFYPENPRVYSALNSDGTAPSQEDIEEHMKRLDHVRELRDDIEANGGLMEEIIVRDGDFVVLEGNSRLAAYRLLCETQPVKWGKIKCKVLPNNIDEELIFRLIGQYHIKGKKPWDAYEQASYLYRRTVHSKIPVEVIAEELNIQKATAVNMIAAVKMMHDHSEVDTRKYSYYFEFVKNGNIRKAKEARPELESRIVTSIQTGEIKKAEDIRLLADVAKVGDKQSKKLLDRVASGSMSIYDAHEEIGSSGKLETSATKLKTFRTYINSETFEKNVLSSEETYKNAVFEINKILRQLERCLKKWEKDGNK